MANDPNDFGKRFKFLLEGAPPPPPGALRTQADLHRHVRKIMRQMVCGNLSTEKGMADIQGSRLLFKINQDMREEEQVKEMEREILRLRKRIESMRLEKTGSPG